MSDIFISYSHKDKKWKDDIERLVLRPLGKKLSIEFWSDTSIKAGDVWRQEIERALLSAKTAIFLVSLDFLGSDFIMDIELPVLLQRARTQGVVILWIKIRPCLDEHPLFSYQAVNDIRKPLSALQGAKREDVLVNIQRTIRDIIIPLTAKHTRKVHTYELERIAEGDRVVSPDIEKLIDDLFTS